MSGPAALPASERPLNTDIQVLRGVAILMVLVEHTQVNLIFWKSALYAAELTYWRGASGVDLFFVISGYVIARSLLPRLAALTGAAFLAETLTFLLRRFWRLQPAAWLWLAVPLVLTATFNRSGAFFPMAKNAPGALAGMLAITNVRNIYIPFGPGLAAQLFNPYWSLAFEEQFYWLLPFAAYVLRKRLHVALLLCFAVQFAFPTELAAHYSQIRPGALALGVLLAQWERSPAYKVAEPVFLRGSPAVRFAFLVGTVGLMGTALCDTFAGPATMPFATVTVLSGILVYAATFDRDYLMRPGLTKRILTWVGARSYALYLTHMPAFAFVREVASRTTKPVWVHTTGEGLAYLVCGWGLSMLLAELTFRFVETPCRRYGRSLKIRPADAKNVGPRLGDHPAHAR